MGFTVFTVNRNTLSKLLNIYFVLPTLIKRSYFIKQTAEIHWTTLRLRRKLVSWLHSPMTLCIFYVFFMSVCGYVKRVQSIWNGRRFYVEHSSHLTLGIISFPLQILTSSTLRVSSHGMHERIFGITLSKRRFEFATKCIY